MTKVINRVEDLLLHGYKTASAQTLRDSDRALLMAFWELDGLYLNDEQKVAFMNATAAESITRARRALKDRYPASPEITEKRYKRFNEYKYENAVML